MLGIFFRKRIVVRRRVLKITKRAIKKVSDFDSAQVKEFREKVLDRLEHYKNFYYEHGIELKWNRVSVRNQKTRWGSCSSKKNLNFNFRMRHLTDELFDYIIVHELCHLVHMNHSSEFWKLVSLAVPDYLDKRNQLRKVRI